MAPMEFSVFSFRGVLLVLKGEISAFAMIGSVLYDIWLVARFAKHIVTRAQISLFYFGSRNTAYV